MVESCRESDRPQQVAKTHSEDEDQVSTSDVCFEDDEEEEEEEDDDGDLKTDCPGGALSLAQKPGDLRPSFGSVVVNNSSDVHFGTKAFYNGPVTIKQFVYTNKNGGEDVRPGTENEESARNENIPAINGSLAPIWQPSPNEEEQKPKETQRPRFLRKWQLLLIISIAGILLIVITLVAIFLPNKVSEHHSSSGYPEDSTVDFRFNVNVDNISVKLIGRKLWLAQPPLHPLIPLEHPVNYVVILHTETQKCSTQSSCVFLTRNIQNYHIERRGWLDIGYSFLIGGDGNVYEGRGWDYRGSFAKSHNHFAIGIAVIGNFNLVLPSDGQIFALKYWIEEGVKLKKISPDYKILTHSQLSATTSPGTAFVRLIQTWPRWSGTPKG